MNLRCPNCLTLYRVDPERVPATNPRARCGRCDEVFGITRQMDLPVPAPTDQLSSAEVGPESQSSLARQDSAPGDTASPLITQKITPEIDASPPPVTTAAAPPPPTPPATGGVHFFGPQDPHQRARNLARALVSDIVAYYPDRIERSRAEGTLRDEFREEILKSWEEFVLQVGSDFARETDHFQTALNDILARGTQVF